MKGMKLHWVPNLFTLVNLTFGFLSILITLNAASEGNRGLLDIAGMLIIFAVFFDGADGLAARLLKASSELGAQLDSLADLTTFGIAPAVLAYVLLFQEFTFPFFSMYPFPLGMLIAATFPVFAAYRLARFNVMHSSDYFSGLPSPVAGLIVALFPVVFASPDELTEIIMRIVFLLIGMLMVSTVRYEKPQASLWKKYSKYKVTAGFLIVIGFIAVLFIRFGPAVSGTALFTIAMVYVITGLVSFVYHLIQEYRF